MNLFRRRSPVLVDELVRHKAELHRMRLDYDRQLRDKDARIRELGARVDHWRGMYRDLAAVRVNRQASA